MANTLVIAPTTLHPTPAQALQLQAILRVADTLHLAVRRWLRLRGTSVCLPLQDALAQVADGHALPGVPDQDLVNLRLDALTALSTFPHSLLPWEWQEVLPAQIFDGLIGIEVKRLQRFGGQARAGEALPLWPLSRLPFDAAARPLDQHHVVIDGVDEPVVADLWALPDALTSALLVQASEHRQAWSQEWEALMVQVEGGNLSAATRLYQLSRCLQSPLPESTVHHWDAARPHRVQHVSLVEATEVTGEPILQLEWTIRVPHAYLPGATIDDTLGIDLGYRRLATAVSDHHCLMVERQVDVHLGLPRPHQPDARQLLAYAQVRRRLLDLHRPEIEALVCTALQYRQVHVERMDWQGLRLRGGAPWTLEAMTLVGAPQIVAWLRLLAPATGTLVRLINPRQTSHTCHRCGRAGLRPRPYTDFCCPVCGVADADINSALVLRQRQEPKGKAR